MIYLILALVALGVVALAIAYFTERHNKKLLREGKIDHMPTLQQARDMQCCGQHEVCERDSLLAALSKEIEYYDDEELDAFAGRHSDTYTETEIEQFREVLYTMQENDVPGWVRSLQLRGVELPDGLKDEVVMIVNEQRAMKKPVLSLLSVMLVLGLMVSCSTKKNTPLTRNVQAFKARYNTYFNGHQAFLEGVAAQREGNKDNYTELIPLFMTSNKSTASIGKSQFERAIEKSQKTIKQHSITVKPQWNGNRPKKPKDRIWLSQKEYNPFLYKAWFLMGEAQMRKGDYIEASATFAYIQRLYFSHPDIVARARLLEAECYAAQDWVYDAENLLSDVRRDSFPTRLEPLRAAVTADCQLRQEQWADAIPNVRRALKLAHGTLEKARLHFLLGQLYRRTDNRLLAFKEFKRVVRLNPPYEIAFNARIQQTEVMAKGQYKQMVRKLKNMARNPKNKDYLDQIYYAIGNIYLAQGDTTHAIYNYKAGVDQSTRSGIEKGVVWLKLGEVYWNQEEFVKAQPCYAGALGLFDKEHARYKEINERSSILEELLPYASAVELQDSLQELARMDSTEMLKVIDRIIDELKEKEKKEQRNAINAATPNATGSTLSGQTGAAAGTQGASQTTAKGQWYFYNAASVQAGKRDFQQKWGQRKLEDNWRRSNKTVLGSLSDETENDSTSMAQSDSTGVDSVLQQQLEGLNEDDQKRLLKQQEYEKDPHRREYYLKDIPFTPEQKAVSDAALVEGLYGSAIIYKDRMENFPLAQRTFQRILVEFPDFEHTDEVCYNMFQLYARQGYTDEAAAFRQRLTQEWPENEHAKLVSDPNFEYKGMYGKQIEDSLYQQAYAAFERGDYATVLHHADYTAREYPEGQNRARFLFLEALSRLEQGNHAQFLSSMKRIVSDYPQSTVSQLAGLYVKGLQDGRILSGGHMDFGSLWTRRSMGLEADSTLTDTVFSADRFAPFVFVIAYMPDSLDENQLLYEVARYNFTNFAVRNFDLNITHDAGVGMLQVRTFQGYEEAYVYTHRLLNDSDMSRKLEGLRTFIISEANLKLLQRGRSFADYFDFYDDNFDPLSRLQLELERTVLDEPAAGDLPTQEELEQQQEEEEQLESEEEEEENYIF